MGCLQIFLRNKIQQALTVEDMNVAQWKRTPVSAQEIFQTQVGYGKGYPWICGYGRPIEYR